MWLKLDFASYRQLIVPIQVLQCKQEASENYEKNKNKFSNILLFFNYMR